jgi:hypothetical protein
LHEHLLLVQPSDVRGSHQFLQETVCPQLSVVEPHARRLHAVLSGAQQAPPDVHTPASGQVAGQGTFCPQLSVAFVLHLPAHAVTSSGVQHVFPVHTCDDEEQLPVPPTPQGTACPQLFVAVPHVLPLHVVASGSGMQPQEPASLHVSPASHPPQSSGCPQLSVLGPQRFTHQAEAGVGAQHV